MLAKVTLFEEITLSHSQLENRKKNFRNEIYFCHVTAAAVALKRLHTGDLF